MEDTIILPQLGICGFQGFQIILLANMSLCFMPLQLHLTFKYISTVFIKFIITSQSSRDT